MGTSRRHGAKEIHQFEILPKPPEGQNPETPWPNWPVIMRTSTSHEEGCNRRWSVLTKQLTGTGSVEALEGIEVDWARDEKGQWKMTEREGSAFAQKADLVLLAMGFVHVVHEGLVEDLGVKLDSRGNVAVGLDYQTSVPGVFSAGDTDRGASLVVWAIREGRDAATSMNQWLREK